MVRPSWSVTSGSITNAPIEDGLPDSTPSADSASPAGSGAGDVKVYGGVPPVTFSAVEYGAPTWPLGRSEFVARKIAGDTKSIAPTFIVKVWSAIDFVSPAIFLATNS